MVIWESLGEVFCLLSGGTLGSGFRLSDGGGLGFAVQGLGRMESGIWLYA